MKIFIGVGLGPIQTNIFFEGAFHGGFDRLVIAVLGWNHSGKVGFDELEAVWCCLQERV